MKCHDCGNPPKKNNPMIVRGVSDLAGGEYYSGPEICEQCAAKRRETAILLRKLFEITGRFVRGIN